MVRIYYSIYTYYLFGSYPGINSNVSYNEYLQELRNVWQVSVTITNEKINQNAPIFPYNNPNQLTIQQNSETETKNNIK